MSAVKSQIRRLFNKACADFDLIQADDKLMVGLSGGKDSLTLLEFLVLLRDTQDAKFSILAAYVKFSNLPYSVDLEYLQEFCKSRQVDFIVIEDQIRDSHMRSGTCIHCSRFRRAKLMEYSRIHKCNKLALGHHLDDVVTTLLMNMTQHGRFAGMAVKLDIKVGEHQYPLTIIRPLCLVSEQAIKDFVRTEGFRSECCRCEWGDRGYRSKAREVVDMLCQKDESVRMNLFKCQFQIDDKLLAMEPQVEADDIEDAMPEKNAKAD